MFQHKDLAGLLAYPQDEGTKCLGLTEEAACGHRRVADEEKGQCFAITLGDTTAQKKRMATALPLLRQQLRRGLAEARL